MRAASRRFFGGGFGFGGREEEEEQTPKGNDVHVHLQLSLRDLYLGVSLKVLPLMPSRQMRCGDLPPFRARFRVSLLLVRVWLAPQSCSAQAPQTQLSQGLSPQEGRPR